MPIYNLFFCSVHKLLGAGSLLYPKREKLSTISFKISWKCPMVKNYDKLIKLILPSWSNPKTMVVTKEPQKELNISLFLPPQLFILLLSATAATA